MKNPRFEIIKQYIVKKKVLDLGIVQHDVYKIKKEYWLHRLICSYSKECIGVDIKKEGIVYLRKKGYEVYLADVQEFNLNRKFEVVVAGELIEHLTNFEGFFTSVKKHMHEESKLILTTPNMYFLPRVIKIIFRGKKINPEHNCWFDELTIKQLLNSQGFEIESIYYTEGQFRYRILPLPQKLTQRTIITIAKQILE